MEGFLMAFLDLVEVFVCVELVHVQLNHGNGNIGAVVGNAFVVGQQIVEDETVRQCAVAGLNPLDVTELDLVAKLVDDLLPRRQGRPA